MTKILGIFTCFNRKEKTIKSLESLMKGNPEIEFSFIAVDDNSTDGTREALVEYQNLQGILGDGRCYYSGGMRLGIEAGKKCSYGYDWILLFNDDVVFFPHAIERLRSYAVEKKEILVGATCDENGQLTYGGVVKQSLIKPAFETVVSQGTRQYCDTFNANCVLIPVEIFEKLPNIDAHYTHSMGDFDYGLEAKKRGVPIVVSDFFVGECSNNPVEGTWRDVRLSRRERLAQKEMPKGLPWKEWFYFVKKHYGVLSACYSGLSPFFRILLGK